MKNWLERTPRTMGDWLALAAGTALLLAVRGGDTLVTLDDSLNQLASVAAGQAKSVSSTATAVYLLTASGVESYGYDGTHNWSRDYGAAPQALGNEIFQFKI